MPQMQRNGKRAGHDSRITAPRENEGAREIGGRVGKPQDGPSEEIASRLDQIILLLQEIAYQGSGRIVEREVYIGGIQQRPPIFGKDGPTVTGSTRI